MYKNLILLILICSFSAAFSQDKKIQITTVNSITFDADQFSGTDTFGFVYLIKDNRFIKTNGKDAYEYKNISLGKITKADLENPLKVVLFYEDFNTVVLLDNQFNETSRINFSKNTTPILTSGVGIASQNQLWIYNTLNQQIGLYNYLKDEYKTVSTPLSGNIKYYQSNFNVFYWVDEKNNWFSCDIFGKVIAFGKIPDFDALTILNNNQYIYKKANLLFFKDISTPESGDPLQIEISEKTFGNFYYKDQILSIFTIGGITNYKIIIP
ncbi:hypothetical protein [Flavobacterium sp. PL02]|uniref:hypothetical protein n=1 Tax=Flavobacterium sp. PL02 TaxID=3088354 RepID=UPI00057D95A0|nr:hypothetical protein [Flavobacterium sp. PL02]KIC04005.1 hypothetical protein OA88_00750 [Flavobacterium sp. JRM]MEA9413329.1 hypothetical protein [Flavobacterium sp. PL02]